MESRPSAVDEAKPGTIRIGAIDISEEDFNDAAKKAVDGDRVGAIEAATTVLATLLTHHPLIGVAVGKGAGMIAAALVDRATQRMLEAEREWDDERAKVDAFKRDVAEAVEPLFREHADDAREHFLQTIRFMSAHVASATKQDESLRLLHELMQVQDRARAEVASASELRDRFTVLHGKLSAYCRIASDVRNGFDLAGASAADPDDETDRDLTGILNEYNAIYKDLRDSRMGYEQPLIDRLGGRPETATRVCELVSMALDDVHTAGILAFNDVYKKAIDVRRLRAELARHEANGAAASAAAAREEIRRLTDDGAALVRERVQRVSRQLAVLERKLQALSRELLERR